MATSKGATVSNAASKGLAPWYALAKNQPGGSNYDAFTAANGGTSSALQADGSVAGTPTKIVKPTPVKVYNPIANSDGTVSYNSFATGWVKTAKDLATAQAEIKAGNPEWTYKINETNTPVFGDLASQLYGSDKSARDKLAVAAAAKWGQSLEDYLAGQEGYTSASAEDQKATLENLKRAQSADVVGNVETQQQIEAVTQEKKEEAFAKEQQARQLQIDNLTMANNGIARSEDLDKAQQNLDAIKQSIAYMGSMGMPGVSSTHLDAISKQIDNAQTTYNNLVKVQDNQRAMEAIGVEYNAANFTKKITDLQYALKQQVSEATQDAINSLMANGNTIDNMDELNMVKGTMMQELDKSIANIAISNQAQRTLILSQYDKVIADGELAAKNANIVNKDLSSAKGIYIDGNGKPILDGNSNTIQYKADRQSSFDASTNTLTTRDPTDPAGTLTQKVVGWGSWGNDSAAQAYVDLLRTNKITMSDVPEKMKNAVVLAMSNANAEWGKSEVAPGIDEATIQKWVTALVAGDQKYQTLKAQCGRGVNGWLNDQWVQWTTFSDPINAKTAATNSTVAKVGSAVVFDWSKLPNATPAQKKYGHVAIVTKIDPKTGLPSEVADWNQNWDKAYNVHSISWTNRQKAISGYFDPTKAKSPTWWNENPEELAKLAQYIVDTQPRWQWYSDDDVRIYTEAINRYAGQWDRKMVLQLYRENILKAKSNATQLDNATFIKSRIEQTQELMKKYEAEWGKMNIFNGTVQDVVEKLWATGNDYLVQIGQNLWMLTADYIRQISGTAAADREVARLIWLLPSTKSTFNRNELLSEWFKQRVIQEAENSIKNTMWINQKYMYDAFPELAWGGQQSSADEIVNAVAGRWNKTQTK